MINLFNRKKPDTDGVTHIPIKEVQTHPDFVSLFPINVKVRDSIEQSIRKEGFNVEFPLVIWEEKNILLDGHTRLAAAKRALLRRVPVVYKSFPSSQEAMDYATSLQFNRRNLNDADLLAFVITLDTENLPGSGRKQDKIARICNISVTKAMRILKVKMDASPHHKNKILDGTLSVNAVYTKLTKKKGQVNSRQPKTAKKSPEMIQIDAEKLNRLVDEWIDHLKSSSDMDEDSWDKIKAIVDLIPAGDYKESISERLSSRKGPAY